MTRNVLKRDSHFCRCRSLSRITYQRNQFLATLSPEYKKSLTRKKKKTFLRKLLSLSLRRELVTEQYATGDGANLAVVARCREFQPELEKTHTFHIASVWSYIVGILLG